MNDETQLTGRREALERLKQLESKVGELSLELGALRSIVSELASSSHSCASRPLGTTPLEAQGKLAKLSPRERQVVKLFAQLHSVKKVARTLGTEPQTVRNQLASIRAKFESSSREEFWEMVFKLRPWLELS